MRMAVEADPAISQCNSSKGVVGGIFSTLTFRKTADSSMKVQLGAKMADDDGCTADTQTLVPPSGRRRRRALLGNWQTALHASTLFISLISLTMSSVVFMVLLYTPASGPLGQGHAISDLRAVSDLQRQVIIGLQRKTSYLEARQKVLQSVLDNAGLLTEDVQERLQGIENALQAKISTRNIVRPMISGGGIVFAVPDQEVVGGAPSETEPRPLIGRPDGHNMRLWDLISRPDGHEQRPDSPISQENEAQDLIGRHDGHEPASEELIGRPDGHDS